MIRLLFCVFILLSKPIFAVDPWKNSRPLKDVFYSAASLTSKTFEKEIIKFSAYTSQFYEMLFDQENCRLLACSVLTFKNIKDITLQVDTNEYIKRNYVVIQLKDESLVGHLDLATRRIFGLEGNKKSVNWSCYEHIINGRGYKASDKNVGIRILVNPETLVKLRFEGDEYIFSQSDTLSETQWDLILVD